MADRVGREGEGRQSGEGRQGGEGETGWRTG